MPEKWLTTQEAAELSGYHPEHLRQLLKAGSIKGQKFGPVWPDIAIVQVVKQRMAEGFHIERRIAQGCPRQIEWLRQASRKVTGVINTAYIERLNATFRLRLSWLTRRTRTLAQQPETLTAGMYIVGCFYNPSALLRTGSVRCSPQPAPTALGWPVSLPLGATHPCDGSCFDRSSMDSR
jgi:hypothetical protein